MYERWSRLRGTCAFQTPENVAYLVATAQLLTRGWLPIHCAAVARGGKVAVIVAPSNTGKTLSTWQLVTNLGFQFVAEDIAILKDGVIYGCPFTSTDVPEGVEAEQQVSYRSLKKVIFPHQPKKCLARCVDRQQIQLSGPMARIFFLRRGSEQSIHEMDRSQADDFLLKNNCLEFRYRSDSLLLELWYRYGSPNLQQMIKTEENLLMTLADRTEAMTEIVAPDPADFARIISDQF